MFSQDHHNVPTDTPYDITELTTGYAREHVHPDDRNAYLDFLDPATLADLVRNNESGFINRKVRTLEKDGKYAKKMYLIVPAGNREFLLLVRYANL